MTEQMAKRLIERLLSVDICVGNENEALKMAIQSLEEIQQYRAIGTVEGFELAIKSSKENYYLYREYKTKVQEYESIGTVEELQALKEKSVAKKPIEKEHTYDWFGTQQFRVNFYCPSCNELVENDYCKCGQHLDWE